MKRLMLTSILLNISWTIIVLLINKLTHSELIYLITTLGFLLIYSFSYFTVFEKENKTIYNFLVLAMSLACIFMIATFVIAMLAIKIDNLIKIEASASMIVFLMASSIVALTSIVGLIGHYRIIQDKMKTIIIGSVVVTTISYIYFLLVKKDLIETIQEWALGFCTWQILTTYLVGRSFVPISKNDYDCRN